MSDWLSALRELNRRGEPAALVTVVDTRGSTPRERGAKMTVTRTEIQDSIGGGQLEHAATESARLLLESDGEEGTGILERYKLGPSLGQCCGGVATLLIERIPARRQSWIDTLSRARREDAAAFIATVVGGGKYVFRNEGELAAAGVSSAAKSLARRAMETGKPVFGCLEDGKHCFIEPAPAVDFNIILFGAGHVGKALAEVLSALPCRLTWLDSRPDQLPERTAANVRSRTVRNPERLVHDCPPAGFYIVMTQSHPLDLAICEQILKRDDFAYCGLIGSDSKRRNFEKRLRLKGVTETALNRLTCPIGVDGISGKRPAEIAVSVAAEVLRIREAMCAQARPGATAVNNE